MCKSKSRVGRGDDPEIDEIIQQGVALDPAERARFVAELPDDVRERVAGIIMADELVQPVVRPPWTRRRVAGAALQVTGTISMLAVLMILLERTNWEGWQILLLAVAVAAPLLIAGGFLMHTRPGEWRRKWPVGTHGIDRHAERKSAEDVVAVSKIVCFLMALMTAVGITGWVAWRVGNLLPDGQEWWKAGIRVGYVVAVLWFGRLALLWGLRRVRLLAINRLPPRYVHMLYRDDESPADSWTVAARRNFGWIVSFGICILLVTRVIDLDSPFFDVQNVRKLRAFFMAARWARDHPGTVTIGCLVLGSYSAARFTSSLLLAESHPRAKQWSLFVAALSLLLLGLCELFAAAG